MIVLGLAGHVDHGKTALVRALSGVDTDRLPEEKARGMTTDLGFASFVLGTGEERLEVGLIDVPGHERYIRNMAAGAWALDLALLVVAADDGWMDQTENHARVLAAFGPPRTILVLSKADKVDGARLEAALEDARGRATAVLGPAALAGISAVSALTGEGIPGLEALIAREGLALERGAAAGAETGCGGKGRRGTRRPGPSGGRAWLYVDRVFTRRGSGLVACGTLLGGPLRGDEEVLLLPAGERLRIKAMESLGAPIERADGPLRLALNLSRPRRELGRGDLISSCGRGGEGAEILVGTEFLLKVQPLPHSGHHQAPKDDVLRKGGELEVAVGSADRIGKAAPLGKGPWLRFSCADPLALPRGQPLALIRQGGADILGRAFALRAGRTDREGRRRLAAACLGLEDLPLAEAEVALKARMESEPSAEGSPPQAGSAAPPPPGPSAGARTGPGLSAAALRAEAALRAAGASGVELGTTGAPGKTRTPCQPSRRDLEELCAAGLAVPFDRELFFHREVYAGLLASALAGKAPGAELSIAEAKTKTGFSRKYVLPFLNRLERDGYVRREGETRRVLRGAGADRDGQAPPGMKPSPR